MIASDALYYNRQAGIYYKEKDQLKRFQLSFQTGFAFNLLSNEHTGLNLGPVFQYGLLNLTKPATNTNEHLLFVGLKTSILFKK